MSASGPCDVPAAGFEQSTESLTVFGVFDCAVWPFLEVCKDSFQSLRWYAAPSTTSYVMNRIRSRRRVSWRRRLRCYMIVSRFIEVNGTRGDRDVFQVADRCELPLHFVVRVKDPAAVMEWTSDAPPDALVLEALHVRNNVVIVAIVLVAIPQDVPHMIVAHVVREGIVVAPPDGCGRGADVHYRRTVGNGVACCIA